MKRSFQGLLGSGIAALLCAAAVSAAEPVPVLDFDFSKFDGKQVKDAAGSGMKLVLGESASVKDGALILTPSSDSFAAADQAAFKAWAKKLDTREIAAAFWIRFDKTLFGGPSNSKVASLGLFDCYRADDGTITVKLFTKKTELLKPVEMKSTFKSELGKWYHVEFSYSMNERRYKLYIDGKFQVENDQLMLPEIAVGDLKLGSGFRGAVKDLKFYDAALPSEELAISKAAPADYDKLSASARGIVSGTKNPFLKAWANELAKRAAAYKADKTVTIAAYKRLANAISNAQVLAAGIADSQNTIADKAVTAYVTPATTQALYLPDDLPENGKLSNKIEMIMAQDEFESASVVVVPFKPVKGFTFKMSDLRNGNSVIKGSDVDIRLVKRWFRTGGAWMSYHVDLYMRVLTPDMLLHDDSLVKVDEFRKLNYLKMRYPGGEKYADVSRYLYDRQWMDGYMLDCFYDAPTLQPMDLNEAGRNQQFIVTVRAKKDTAPGFYDGKLQMLADGRDAGTLNVTVRVLPFVLPQPASYTDTSKRYISHVNSYDGVPATLQNAMDHNLMDLSNIGGSVDRLKTAVKIGYPMDIMFDTPQTADASFGGPKEKITPALRKRMDDMILAPFLRWQKRFEKITGIKDYTVYRCQTSEASWYGAISSGPDELSVLLNQYTHFKLFSHGMTKALPYFSPGIYDMNSASGLNKEFAEIWHSVGGRSINYAFPFPGPENPGLMRRAMGLELYKAFLYDGHMMHGYVGRQFNEFTKYPGGDGDYRTFCIAYAQKDGCINRIAIVGCREGYDDVRYATMLKKQAEDVLKTSKDELVRREAKRQLAWLQRVDGNTMDMDAFRVNAQVRIMALMNLIKERKGK